MILGTIALGVLLVCNFSSVALALPDEQCDARQMGAESMHEHFNIRLNKLSERLEFNPHSWLEGTLGLGCDHSRI